MSTWVTCATCGIVGDPANMDLIFQEESTYPGYWQCKNPCGDEVFLENDDDDDSGSCWRCGGQGFIVTCIDDMCRGAGECFHGDGEAVCPECKGASAY